MQALKLIGKKQSGRHQEIESRLLSQSQGTGKDGFPFITDVTRSMNSREYVCASEKHCSDLNAYSKSLQNKEKVDVCSASLDFKFQENVSLPLTLYSLSFFSCLQ